ncbi:hypothetical protein KM188_14865 [Mycetohabitans sp. B4]|nr:hypothetical protein [Mycetohabitans sp. B4]
MSSDRQQVLVAFQEVEDNLANLRILTDQIQAQNDDSVQASGRTAQLSRAQYREGSVSYLDVIDSERTVLQNQRAAMQLIGATVIRRMAAAPIVHPIQQVHFVAADLSVLAWFLPCHAST